MNVVHRDFRISNVVGEAPVYEGMPCGAKLAEVCAQPACSVGVFRVSKGPCGALMGHMAAFMQVRISECEWMVIDLELAAFADQELPRDFCLADWDEDTLDAEGRYTRSSDMHQIGVLLSKCHVRNLSWLSRRFITALKAKQLTGLEALQHDWLRERARE